jgi:predicted Zn-dependent protease with MMP-like domain
VVHLVPCWRNTKREWNQRKPEVWEAIVAVAAAVVVEVVADQQNQNRIEQEQLEEQQCLTGNYQIHHLTRKKCRKKTKRRRKRKRKIRNDEKEITKKTEKKLPEQIEQEEIHWTVVDSLEHC